PEDRLRRARRPRPPAAGRRADPGAGPLAPVPGRTHAMSFVAPMRCSALAEQLDEPMAGTVDQRRRWICVEDRSPWGEKAVRDLLGADLEARAKAAAIRLLLIRRREGDPAADAVRRVFVA